MPLLHQSAKFWIYYGCSSYCSQTLKASAWNYDAIVQRFLCSMSIVARRLSHERRDWRHQSHLTACCKRWHQSLLLKTEDCRVEPERPGTTVIDLVPRQIWIMDGSAYISMLVKKWQKYYWGDVKYLLDFVGVNLNQIQAQIINIIFV